MNTKRIVFLVSASLIAAVSFSRAASVGFKASPQSKIWIEGKSTLHPFTIKASTFDLQMNFKAAHKKNAAAEILKGQSAQLTVTVPIKGLKSEFEVMDENTQKAMKAQKHPDVIFSLTSYAITQGGKKETISVPGTLSISGVSKPVTLQASIVISKSKITISGNQEIRMSDYGIKPPTMMFDTIKVEDRVSVHYHLILSPQTSQVSLSRQQMARN